MSHSSRRSEGAGPIELTIASRRGDIGGVGVRRVLPARERQRVGPFIFIDHIGPVDFAAGQGVNVKPHPHIGLATVTYLFAGEILHRDSLGYVQAITPGAVNLMTAGRGIVHSERTPPALLASGQHVHGIQTWMALPVGQEEMAPAFEHVAAERLPVYRAEGVRATVIIGAAFGVSSPVAVHVDTLYADLDLSAGVEIALPREVAELGVYSVAGSVRIGACPLAAGSMSVLRPGHRAVLRAETAARVILAGGAPVGDRHIFWNFVSSSAESIERAKDDWRNHRFDPVPGDDEYTPLPGPGA